MIQILYTLVAIALLAMIGLNLQRGAAHTAQQQTFNEVATQLTGVGIEVLEHIARDSVYFDRHAFDFRSVPPACGRIDSTQIALFADPAAFGGQTYTGSRFIEGFHGLKETIDRDGLEYEVGITVRYVDEVTHVVSSTETFAKEVLLDITNPYLHLGDPDNPVTVRMSRVFTYDKVTEKKYIPYTPSGCPPV